MVKNLLNTYSNISEKHVINNILKINKNKGLLDRKELQGNVSKIGMII